MHQKNQIEAARSAIITKNAFEFSKFSIKLKIYQRNRGFWAEFSCEVTRGRRRRIRVLKLHETQRERGGYKYATHVQDLSPFFVNWRMCPFGVAIGWCGAVKWWGQIRQGWKCKIEKVGQGVEFTQVPIETGGRWKMFQFLRGFHLYAFLLLLRCKAQICNLPPGCGWQVLPKHTVILNCNKITSTDKY